MKKRECKACHGRGYVGTAVAMRGYVPGKKIACSKCGGVGFKIIKTEEELKAEAINAETEKIKEALEVK